MGKFPSTVRKMNVIRNGLRQDLNFKGALHLSLRDTKIAGTDKLVININETNHTTWVDFICLYEFTEEYKEFFRIGGGVLNCLEGHIDLHKWMDYCIKELDWEEVFPDHRKDQILLEIFNFINRVADTIISEDTEDALKNEEGLGVMTYYPWPEDNDDQEEEEVDEEIEEVIEEEITEEEGEEEYSGINKPLNPNDVIQFLDYKLTKIEDGGLGCKSPNFIFSYYNEEVYSKLDLFIEKDSEGNPHITKADLYQHGFGGSKDKTKSIADAEDLQDLSNRKEEFIARIIKAARFGSVTSKSFYKDRLEKDLLTLIKALLLGMEWKESLTSEPTDPVQEEDDEY